ncbi:MAG: lactonase family protein [Clostridium sp.]|nr:lactonase family protein [Clostridium sp.]
MANNRHIAQIAAVTLLAAAVSCTGNQTGPADTPADTDGRQLLLVGSYSPADHAGIKLYSFDPETAAMTLVDSLAGISNPSYQAISDDEVTIYSVGEENGVSSTANTIRLDRDSLRMTLVNSVATGGGAPCYINTSPDGRFLLTANYLGGSVSIFPLDSAGTIAGVPDVIPFAGNGPVTDRQEQPHLHCVEFTPDGRFLLADDLGTDRIHMFPLSAGTDSTLTDPSAMTDVTLEPGSGPRHIVFDNSGSHAYLINEISGAVTMLDYDGKTLVARQYIQADTVGAQGSGDIHLSPDGRYLYASNRLKADGIAIFAVNPDDGTLSRAGYQPTGPHPRNFVISPDGRWLLVACRDSDEIEVYSRDPESGLLTRSGQTIATPRPVCLKFL